MTFNFRNGYRTRGNIGPNIVGQSLGQIMEAHNHELRPETVVDAARPEDHPLHHCFLWDDQHAAELYRRSEARQMIRALIITEPTGNTEPAFTSVVVSTVSADGTTHQSRSYQPSREVVADPDKLQSAILDFRVKIAQLSHSVDELTRMAEESGSEKAPGIRRARSRISLAMKDV